MIGLTGSTGHLGQVITAMNPDVQVVDRDLPSLRIDTLIHAAAPNWRDETAITMFDLYNYELCRYIVLHKISTIVNIGSWWQYADGNCAALSYSLLKNRQIMMMGKLGVRVVTLVPFSIYGDEARAGRGFIPQLVQAIRNNEPLSGLSNQPRDFVHVQDVARACLLAPSVRAGIYLVATGMTSTPKEIANQYGITAPAYDEYPTGIPRYLFDPLPGWSPRVNLHAHIVNAIR